MTGTLALLSDLVKAEVARLICAHVGFFTNGVEIGVANQIEVLGKAG